MLRFSGRFAAIALALALWSVPNVAHAQLLLMDGFPPFTGFGPYGSTRLNMSVAPTLTMYNGQTSLMMYQGFPFYPSNNMVVQSGGAIAFVPQQQPVPLGLNLPVRAAFGPGGRGRLDLAPTLQQPGLGPAFPITSFIRPMYAGGAIGGSVPFTRVIYPPSFSQVGIQTSVGAGYGGQPFVGGGYGGVMGRSEFGTPVFGRFPIINQPFMNVGVFGGAGAFPVFAPRINVQ